MRCIVTIALVLMVVFGVSVLGYCITKSEKGSQSSFEAKRDQDIETWRVTHETGVMWGFLLVKGCLPEDLRVEFTNALGKVDMIRDRVYSGCEARKVFLEDTGMAALHAKLDKVLKESPFYQEYMEKFPDRCLGVAKERVRGKM